MNVGTGVAAIPLAALRPAMAGGWPLGSRWLPEDGDHGYGSVEHPTGSVLAFRLDGAPAGRLRGKVSIANAGPHKPRGVVRVRAMLRVGERSKAVWTGFIAHGTGRRRHTVEFDTPLIAGATELQLQASKLRPKDHGVTRVCWQGPAIEVPAAAGSPPAATSTEDGAPARSLPDSLPLISILTPVHNPTPPVLEEMLDSVRGQSFPNWELRLVDDGSTDPEVIAILERAAAEDDRVHLKRHEKAGGISAATNTALEGAEGEYIALLDHDDVLAEGAIEEATTTIAEWPEVDMIYSDEDVIDEGVRVALFRKPSWSPDLMRSHMYTCHFGVYRRALAVGVGGFRSDFDGSQDYDFVLRFSEQTEHIAHIPQVLYHWRSHKGSVADDLAAKPHAYAAARRAIAEHLDRMNIEADVHFDAQRCWYRIDHRGNGSEPVALILPVPSASGEFVRALDDAVRSWRRTESPPWQLVLAGPAEAIDPCREALAGLLPPQRLQAVVAPSGSSHSTLVNLAVGASSAPRLILLESPVEPLTSTWLSRLVTQVGVPGIGAVGAKTLAADGRVEQAGFILQGGLPLPVLLGADQIEPGPMAVLQVTGNFAAVAGTVAIGRETFERLGGLDERFNRLAAGDFCLRARHEGLRIISSPDAVVRRTEASPPVNDLGELLDFRARWAGEIPRDPYFDDPAATTLTGVGPPP